MIEGISDYSTFNKTSPPQELNIGRCSIELKNYGGNIQLFHIVSIKQVPHKSWIIINFSSISFSIQMAPCNLPGKFLASNLKRTYTSAGLVCIMIRMRSFILIPCCLFI
jgi:hypothetical protein